MAGPIGSEALIPNAALKRFEALIGEWRVTGTHPFMPDTTLHGRASFAWQDGGAFVVMHTEIDEPKFPSGVAYFGSDDAAGTFSMLYFDERGVSRKYDVAVEGNTFTWSRDDPKLSQTNTITVQSGGKRMVGKGRMSQAGGAWEDDLSLTYERVPQ